MLRSAIPPHVRRAAGAAAALLVALLLTAPARALGDELYRPIRRLGVPRSDLVVGRALAAVGDRLLVAALPLGVSGDGPHAFLMDPATGAVVLDLAAGVDDAGSLEVSVGQVGTNLFFGFSAGASTDDGGVVLVFDGATGAALQTICCTGALATGSGAALVVAGAGGGGVFDPASGDLLRSLTISDPNQNGVTSVVPIGTRRVALAARNPVGITLFDVPTGRAVGFLGTRHGDARELGYAMAARGTVLAVSERPQVYLFDVGIGLVLGHVDDPGGRRTAHYFGSALAWTDDALVVGSMPLLEPGEVGDGGAVHLFDAATGAPVQTLVGDDPAALFGIAVAGLGRSVAVGLPSRDGGAVVIYAPCGDGRVDPPVELCDDGNVVDGDGCDADCRPTTTTAPVCGDADGDGATTLTDGVQALRAAAALPSVCTAARCDVDGGGTMTLTDAIQILRAAAGLAMRGDCGAS